MSCSEYSTELSPNTGGKLIISYEGAELYSREIEPVDKEEIHEFSDSFFDGFDNSYTVNISIADCVLDISVEQGTSGIRADFQDEICNGMSVDYYEDMEEKYFEDTLIEETVFKEETDYIDIMYKEPTDFFTIKMSQKEDIQILNKYYNEKNLENTFTISKLSQLASSVKKDSIIFLSSGGDRVAYNKGLYGVAKVIKEPYDKEVPPNKKREIYKIDVQFVYFFKKVISRKEFNKCNTDTADIPNIGASISGEQNQAISKITLEQAKLILDCSYRITEVTFASVLNIFPWLQKDFIPIADKNNHILFDNYDPILNVLDIAKVFANYIVHYNSASTSTLIGIFGKWGRGKTKFYQAVENSIEKINNQKTNKKKKFYFTEFQPWKYQEKESAWAHLYQQILDSYLEHNTNKYNKLFYKYSRIIQLNFKRLGGVWYVLKTLGILIFSYYAITMSLTQKLSFVNSIIGLFGVAGTIYLFKSFVFLRSNKDLINEYIKTKDYSRYLGFQNEIEKELTFLLSVYINEKKERLILFVDDLDRCNEHMIINIIDWLRLVLDNDDINMRLTIITAIDERILKKAIKHKYFTKDLLDINGSNKVTTKEYLEKFFLIAIKLNHLSDVDIENLVTEYTDKLNIVNNEALVTSNKKIKADISTETRADTSTETRADTSTETRADTSTETRADTSTETGAETDISNYVLNEEEIISIKKELIKLKNLTPRKINMMIHRYLIFKSLVLTTFGKDNSLEEGLLIELVIKSQKKRNIKEYIQHYNNDRSLRLLFPKLESIHKELTRDEYITLVKFAEMVSPF